MIKIPRCMSTQHPDNITNPFFSDSEVLYGEAEVKEAFYVFSELQITEQMWDSEGKEVDNQVVEKLLSNHTDFFKRKKLGKDLFLTYRAPNPAVEKEQGKILLETLHSIPRAFDVANPINEGIAPIFEVILPMTTSAEELEMVKSYYEKIIIGQKNTKVGHITIKEWVGDFQPETINVIPLFENYDSFLSCREILKKYLNNKKFEYQRVFLARSDPALNYGSVPAVLMAKIALQNLYFLEKEASVEIYPILGVGGAPFRGNFRPDNISNCMNEYPSVQTFTIQSSFKYDHNFREVVKAVDEIKSIRRKKPLMIDETEAISIISKIKHEYQKQMLSMVDLINYVALYVPSKRMRKLHVGLFGYSRAVGNVKLPRAIKFCASFYSLGLPPEILGLSALDDKEFEKLHDYYTNLDEDLNEVFGYLCLKNLEKLPPIVRKGVKKVLEWVEYEPNERYEALTENIFSKVRKNKDISHEVRQAAFLRKFLG